MELLPGVYLAPKKDGSVLYRSSITHRGKHISLGSFPSEQKAHQAYLEAGDILSNTEHSIASYSQDTYLLSFGKCVSLINFRDHGIYFKTPIYLKEKYFLYYIDQQREPLKFAADDLFFYSTHTIMQRGGHLFVADYGMQVSLLSRYGIRSFAVCGRDYRFVNGDASDLRYENIEVINKYYGVQKKESKGRVYYAVYIHVRSSLLVGKYPSETAAAAAYNKAAHILSQNGIAKSFPKNYITELTEEEYHSLYQSINVSPTILNYHI